MLAVGFSDSMMPFSMASERYMHALRVIFYEENGNIVYRFAGNACCEVEDQTINYVGHTDPITADDNKVFNMIYSKYA